MKPVFFLIGLLATSILGQIHYQDTTPVVDLGYVQYNGSHNATTGINSWFGLRYAQAPVGELRWQAPLNIESKNNHSASRTVDASKPGPSCMQGYPAWFAQRATPSSTEDEDCLLLDVIVPAEPVSTSLPVMIQIHDGGYTLFSSQTEAPGNLLVNQSNGNLVYVSIQYRLGAYGFLGGSEVSARGAANAGLLDQRAALMWVQRHISKFGGDPSQVTIVGGSAGGGSIINQMIVYGGVDNPPFGAAIAEYPWMQPYHSSSALQKQFDTLRETYLTAYENGLYGYGDFYFGPYIDGRTIQDLPSNEFNLGHSSKIPLLTNREGYEGYSFTNTTQSYGQSEMMQDLEKFSPHAKQSFYSRLFEFHPPLDFNSTLFQHSALFGDAIIACSSSYFSAAVSDHGLPVWKMVFYAGSETYGAPLPYLYGTRGTPNNATLAEMLRNHYISFATSLDPNAVDYTGVRQPEWPAYQSPGVSGFQMLNITYSTIGPSDDLDARPQCDFLHSQNLVIGNW